MNAIIGIAGITGRMGHLLAEEVLAAGAVGPHIARALQQVVSSYGPTIIPNIDAAVEVLEAAPQF